MVDLPVSLAQHPSDRLSADEGVIAEAAQQEKPTLRARTQPLKSNLLAVASRALVATAGATASALSLFLLSRWFFQVPYHGLNLAEAIVIPILVGFPITACIFHQSDRLADARVALARQARDNERQRTLINELNHRVKNTLATVMSLSAQTARGTSELPSFLDLFNSRIVALAGAHDLLCRQGWSKVSLCELAGQVLKPHAQSILAEGPEVRLRPAAALSLSMALHELATNAAKYGSLSANGTVAIRWSLGENFHLSWTEAGGPTLMAAPTRTGFGTRLIKQVVVQELDGDVEFDYRPQGLTCRLLIPVENID
jgi:two-component sensor histidine kinase